MSKARAFSMENLPPADRAAIMPQSMTESDLRAINPKVAVAIELGQFVEFMNQHIRNKTEEAENAYGVVPANKHIVPRLREEYRDLINQKRDELRQKYGIDKTAK